MTTVTLSSDHPGKATVHSLPCKIKYTGKAKVSDYFVETAPNTVIPNGCGIDGSIIGNKLDQSKYSYDRPVCYFRGRALLKKTVKLDDGVKGFKLQHTPTGNNTETVWATKGVFDEMNVWSLSNKSRDKYEKNINNWFKISQIVHGSVDDETNEKAIDNEQ